MSKVIQNVADPILIAGYAAGFAAGTILGSYLENIIGVGSMVVKVFVPNESNNLANLELVSEDKNGMLACNRYFNF